MFDDDTNTEIIEQRLTTKAIGERAQGEIVAEVMRYGYTVLIPFGEGRRYDLVIEKNRQFLRLQCKAARYKNGVVQFNTCSVNWWSKTKKSYTREEIDYFAVYCDFVKKAYLIPVENVAGDVGYLRVEPTANNQVKGIRWAEDYAMETVLISLEKI